MTDDTWPKYRIIPWIDTRPEAFDCPEMMEKFGVQAQIEKGGKWMHCIANGRAAIFDTQAEAVAVIEEAKARNATVAAQKAREARRAPAMSERAWACVRHYPRGKPYVMVDTIRRIRRESIDAYLDGWNPNCPGGDWQWHQELMRVRCERVTVELEAGHV